MIVERDFKKNDKYTFILLTLKQAWLNLYLIKKYRSTQFFSLISAKCSPNLHGFSMNLFLTFKYRFNTVIEIIHILIINTDLKVRTFFINIYSNKFDPSNARTPRRD